MPAFKSAKEKQTSPAAIASGLRQLADNPDDEKILQALIDRVVGFSPQFGPRWQRSMDVEDVFHDKHGEALQAAVLALVTFAARPPRMDPFHVNMLIISASNALTNNPKLFTQIDAYAFFRAAIHAIGTDVEQAPVIGALEALLGLNGLLAGIPQKDRVCAACSAAFGDIWWELQQINGARFGNYAIVRDRPRWLIGPLKSRCPAPDGILLPLLDLGL